MNKKLTKILHPKNHIIILGIITIIISLFYLIIFNGFGTPISYVLYLLMTYSLIIICIKTYKIVKAKINIIIDSNKYLKKYKDDHNIRHKISLYISLTLNIIYAMLKLITGIVFKSIWFISFALYYLLLAFLRINILKQELKDSSIKNQYIKYRNTAVILLFTNVILTMIILVIVNQKIVSIYPTWIAISISVYTFYLIFISIYNLIKYRKYKNPLISSSKVINVITSLISLISLEIVLIPTFRTEDTPFFEIMVTSTGGMIAIIIVTISLYMIIKSTEWLNNNS